MKKVIYLLLMLLVPLLAAMQQDNYSNHLLNDRDSPSVMTIIEEAEVHLAAHNGDIETVKKLLDNGVSANVRNADYETPLHVASRAGNDAIVQFLLTRKGIDINAEDATLFSTPLHLAVLYEKFGVAQLLLAQKGIAINARDLMGSTPLHYGVFHRNNAIVKLLLAKEGIDAHIKSNDGRTPLDIAHDNGFGNIVKILGDFLERQLFQMLDFTEDEKKRIKLSSFKTAPPQLHRHTMQRMRAAQAIQSRSTLMPTESATFTVALSYMSKEDDYACVANAAASIGKEKL